MRRILFIFFCFFLLFPSLSFSGIYKGLEPGLSKKSDADKILGRPVREIVKDEKYEYDPKGTGARQINITFNKQTQVIEGIEFFPERSITKANCQKWLGLKIPTVTQKHSTGNLVEYYADEGISLLYSGPQDTYPIEIVANFNPLPLRKKIEGEKTVTPGKMEASKKIPEREEPSRPGDVASVLFEDTFESENGRKGQLNYTGFKNWDVIQGSVDLIGRGFWDYFPDHGLHVDLDGTTGKAGTLSSKKIFRLEQGSYRLEFDLAGNPLSGPNTVTVRLGRVYNEVFTLGKKEPFRKITRNISVSTMEDTRLVFQHAGGDDQGLFLDNIRLSRLTSQSTVTPRGYYDQAMDKSPRELITGKWRWFNGLIVEIKGGGMVAKDSRGNMVNSGSWRVLDASKRKFEMRWGGGDWIDTLILSHDNNSLEGVNQRNERVSANRITR